MKLFAVALALLMLSACASTPEKIVSTPVGGTLPIPISNPTIVTDLQSATYNLDQAVAIGALPADDPAPKCLHGFLVKAGIELPAGQAAPKSFAPKNDGLVSLGAIAYIQVQQARVMSGQGVTVSMDCKALLGQFVLDGAAGVAKLIPVRGLLR